MGASGNREPGRAGWRPSTGRTGHGLGLAVLGGALALLMLLAVLPTSSPAQVRAAGAPSTATAPPGNTAGGNPPRGRSPAEPDRTTRLSSWHHAPAAETQQPATVRANNWTNVFPDLYTVSGLADGEAWAGGEYGHLLHFDGATWLTVDPPNLRGIDLWDLKMLSPSDGWIPAGAQAFEYDGSGWNDQSNGLGLAPGLQVGLVAPLGRGNVWGIGHVDSQDTLLHWDGSTWSASGPTLPGTVYLYDLAMVSGSEGWAVGDEAQDGGYVPVVLHYDGTGWARVPGPAHGLSLFSVWAGAPGEAWMVGTDAQGGQIYRYASGTWSAWTPPDHSQPFRIYMASNKEGWVSTDGSLLHWDGSSWAVERSFPGQVLQGLTGAAGRVWAVGGLDTILIRFETGQWLQQQGGPTVNDLYGVAALSREAAWAVGAHGTILHFDGITWRAQPVATHADLNAVQMLAADEGYAVGGDLTSGVIARWDGAQWTVVATTPAPLYGLAMQPGGDGWAVGADGTLWKASNGIWLGVASPTSASLNAIAMDSASHGWAVGGGLLEDSAQPVVLEYTGGRWVDRTATLPAGAPGLFGLVLGPGGDGWAVGNRTGSSPILHLLGGRWSLAPADDVVDLRGVAPEALGEAWAVGCAAYHYINGAWQAQAFPTNAGYCLSGLALVPGQGGWAVGNAGKILHYNPLAAGQHFYDVPPSSPFYSYIGYMADHDIISGYADNTFRPYSNVTRGQLAKMVVGGMGWPVISPSSATFHDVPPDHPFFGQVETAAAFGVVSGYDCGGPGEPCDGQRRPYFRPAADVTRGQLTKIIVGAKGWGAISPAPATFADVGPNNPFAGYIARAAQKGIAGGYDCGGRGEPCPGAYFRSTATATRGQVSKILYLALTQP